MAGRVVRKLVLVLAVAWLPAVAAADTAGPDITAFSFDQDHYEVGEAMAITVTVSDATSIGQLYFRFEHEAGGGAVYDAYRFFDPSVPSGTYTIHYAWPSTTQPGTYHVTWVFSKDGIGNTRHQTDDFPLSQRTVTVGDVGAPVDAEGPTITAFHWDAASYQPGESMAITVSAVDATSISQLYFRFEHEAGGGAVYDAYRFFDPSVPSGTYTLHYAWPTTAQEGTYHATWIFSKDGIGNTRHQTDSFGLSERTLSIGDPPAASGTDGGDAAATEALGPCADDVSSLDEPEASSVVLVLTNLDSTDWWFSVGTAKDYGAWELAYDERVPECSSTRTEVVPDYGRPYSLGASIYSSATAQVARISDGTGTTFQPGDVWLITYDGTSLGFAQLHAGEPSATDDDLVHVTMLNEDAQPWTFTVSVREDGVHKPMFDDVVAATSSDSFVMYPDFGATYLLTTSISSSVAAAQAGANLTASLCPVGGTAIRIVVQGGTVSYDLGESSCPVPAPPPPPPPVVVYQASSSSDPDAACAAASSCESAGDPPLPVPVIGAVATVAAIAGAIAALAVVRRRLP